MAVFIGVLDREPGALRIAFRDCPGCAAMGADLEEVYANAMDALGEWVRDARDAGFDPKPRDILELRKDRDVLATLEEGGSFLLVPLLIESGRSVRANISMDQGLLESIDEAAKRIGVTRSSFLASAARDKIAALARGPSATSARSVPTLAEPDG